MIGDMGASSNLKRNTRIVGSLVKSISARRSIGEEIAGMEGSEKENKREKGSRTKIDKTSLWIPAACAAGRPHCSKCPARYEIMSVCILRHNDNLSRLRPVEFLLSASLEPFPYLCFRDLTSYFQSAMVATSLSCSFPPSPSILSLSLFFFLFLQFFLFFLHSTLRTVFFSFDRHRGPWIYIVTSVTYGDSHLAGRSWNRFSFEISLGRNKNSH